MHLIDNLKPGKSISDAYRSTISLIESKDKSLIQQLHSNLGFGIGTKYKEDELSINQNNDLQIKTGMVFHVRITFKDVGGKGPIALADTILIED